MKNDLLTAIVAAVAGLVISFLITNALAGSIEDFTYKTVETTVDANLIEPSPEVFNYRALNPTVEVFIGSCAEYNTDGQCVERTETDPNLNNEASQENL